ncbi:MAG: DUF4129 domain-containing protein [Candidatus Thermoplasmatota archaeon]
MDRKNAIGVTFILFLVSAWLIGNMMNFQYDGGVSEVDLSYLLVMITLLPFVMAGIIIYRGRTRMFLFIFSFALFWIIYPVFFRALGVLYIGLIVLGVGLLFFALKKGYISSKKVALTSAFFMVLGASLFYIYSDLLAAAMYSQLPSAPIDPENVSESFNYVWDKTDVAVESVGGPGFFILMMISVFGLGFFIYQKLGLGYKSRSDKEDEKEKMEEDITSTVDRAITELHQGKDVESTILRCYQEMCLILRGEGVEDKDFMTPRELEIAAVKKLDIPDSQISSIRRTFELAKYSSHKLGSEEKDEVLQGLKALKEVLK